MLHERLEELDRDLRHKESCISLEFPDGSKTDITEQNKHEFEQAATLLRKIEAPVKKRGQILKILNSVKQEFKLDAWKNHDTKAFLNDSNSAVRYAAITLTCPHVRVSKTNPGNTLAGRGYPMSENAVSIASSLNLFQKFSGENLKEITKTSLNGYLSLLAIGKVWGPEIDKVLYLLKKAQPPWPILYPEHYTNNYLHNMLHYTPYIIERGKSRKTYLDTARNVWKNGSSDPALNAKYVLESIDRTGKDILATSIRKVLLSVPDQHSTLGLKTNNTKRVLQHILEKGVTIPVGRGYGEAKVLQHSLDNVVFSETQSMVSVVTLVGNFKVENNTPKMFALVLCETNTNTAVAYTDHTTLHTFLQLSESLVRSNFECGTLFVACHSELCTNDILAVAVSVPKEISYSWIPIYCDLISEIYKYLVPDDLDSTKDAIIKREEVIVRDTIAIQQRNSKSKKSSDCNAKAGRLFYYNGNATRNMGKFNNGPAGVYLLGSFKLVHDGHKMSDSSPLPVDVNVSEPEDNSEDEAFASTGMTTRKRRANLNSIEKIAAKRLRLPNHSLEVARERLEGIADVVFLVRYMICPIGNTEADYQKGESVDLLFFDKKYYRVNGGQTADMWSYSEDVVYKGGRGVGFNPIVGPGGIHISSSQGLRCDGIAWAFGSNINIATACMERMCVDATMCTSSGDYALLRMVASDANHHTVPVVNSLISRQTHVLFSFVMVKFLKLCYGRALRQNSMIMCDGDPKLEAVVRELHSSEGYFIHPRGFGGCEYHALNKRFTMKYGTNAIYDGGVGYTLVDKLKHLFRRTASIGEAYKTWQDINIWLNSLNPEPSDKHQIDSLGASKIKPPLYYDGGKIQRYLDKQIMPQTEQIVWMVEWEKDAESTKDGAITWETDAYLSQLNSPVIHNQLIEAMATYGGKSKKTAYSNAEKRKYSTSIDSIVTITNNKLFRIHWKDLPHTHDTYETRKFLQNILSSDKLDSLEADLKKKQEAYPEYGIRLPPPDIRVASVGQKSNIGWTGARKYILTTFAESVWRDAYKLGLWTRLKNRHLFEFTTNRVEGSFMHTKYTYIEGTLEKYLTKNSPTWKVVDVTHREAKRKQVHHLKTVNSDRTRLRTVPHALPSLQTTITTRGIKLTLIENKKSEKFESTFCSCNNVWIVSSKDGTFTSEKPPENRVRLKDDKFLVCDCPVWSGYGIPCSHVITVIKSIGEDIIPRSFAPRWFIEVYAADVNIKIIRDILWGEHGIFDAKYSNMPGPRLKTIPISDKYISGGKVCNKECGSVVHNPVHHDYEMEPDSSTKGNPEILDLCEKLKCLVLSNPVTRNVILEGLRALYEDAKKQSDTSDTVVQSEERIYIVKAARGNSSSDIRLSYRGDPQHTRH